MATQTKTPRKKAPAAKKPKATRKSTTRQATAEQATERHTPRGLFALIVAAAIGICAGLVLLVRRFSHRAAATS